MFELGLSQANFHASSKLAGQELVRVYESCLGLGAQAWSFDPDQAIKLVSKSSLVIVGFRN